MDPRDASFQPGAGLERALALLRRPPAAAEPLPDELPQQGLGDEAALELLAGHVLGRAARLGAPHALAHMDPPTPWLTWALALWSASLNQNLLHPATAPFAREAEALVLRWLAPRFGLQGGWFCSGSSLANLTALWAARDAGGVRGVVASQAAHVSIQKACRILQLPLVQVATDERGRLDPDQLPDLREQCLVLTAGTTATGAIDPLELTGAARWTHLDAAWAGPLRLCPRYAHLLAGCERADSLAVSAHKWLFQPKESAVVLFRDLPPAQAALQIGGGYLAAPSVGVQGSRGAAAVSLLGTLLAWGEHGVARRVEGLMDLAKGLADTILACPELELWNPPATAVNVFRPRRLPVTDYLSRTPPGMFSTCVLAGETWVRSVAANPLVNGEAIARCLLAAAAV